MGRYGEIARLFEEGAALLQQLLACGARVEGARCAEEGRVEDDGRVIGEAWGGEGRSGEVRGDRRGLAPV